MGDEDPGDGALDAGFEVFGEASASAEPGEGSFLAYPVVTHTH